MTRFIFYDLDDYRPVPCERPGQNPKGPIQLKMQPVSDSQIIAIWNKDLGDGYRYKMNIKVGTTVITKMEGMLSFGSTIAVVVAGLQPNQPYNFEIYHECESQPGTASGIRTRSATTLQQGNQNHYKEREICYLIYLQMRRFHFGNQIKSNRIFLSSLEEYRIFE